jgi:hypothetical protein
MYEFRDEAIDALTPKVAPPVTDSTVPESLTFKHLAVSRIGCVTHVEFKDADSFGTETVRDMNEDFVQLAEHLVKNSKVLVDFEGVQSFCPASIGTLIDFNKTLRTKGSRTALCSLAPSARKSFYAD